VLIVADDLGWGDVGFMGSSWYETPNLERLARAGMAFTQAYAAVANCAASLASLMTGNNETAHGIYTVGSSERGDSRTRRIVPVKIKPPFALTFLPSLLCGSQIHPGQKFT